ncbi:hypothetical protein JCM3766R1_000624 [Sporobolomyces carnicolor]
MSGLAARPRAVDYFSSKAVNHSPTSSRLDERDLAEPFVVRPEPRHAQPDDVNRLAEALHHLSPMRPHPASRTTRSTTGGSYFNPKAVEPSTSSSLSTTPSLESDSSSCSLSASCSPLSTPLDYSDYASRSYGTNPFGDQDDDERSRNLDSHERGGAGAGIARRRRVELPKLEIPPFQLDASYFATAPPKPRLKQPSSFQFDVSPPRRSKTAYSASLPASASTTTTTTTNNKVKSGSSSWNPEPIDLAGIMGERPGSPIRFRQKRRDNGFAF